MEHQENRFTTWEDCYRLQRNFLIAYAFRMTGSLADAEDIVQDTVTECLKHDFNTIVNHRAWMTRICSNKTLDLLKSAHKNRNSYVGTWLPDTIPDSLHAGLSQEEDTTPLELSESVTISFLVLLQTLGPSERAVFLLKEIFGYSFKEIAGLVGKSEPACRKIAERARTSVSEKNKRFPRPSADAENLIRRFFDAAQMGNQDVLETLLADESVFFSDGGGKVPAAPMIAEKEHIVAFFIGLRTSPIFTQPNYRLQIGWVNARPGMTIAKRTADNRWEVETMMSFEIEAGKIIRIFAQRNPDKLKAVDSVYLEN